MSKPRVSIVIPSYNHLHYLPRALETALDQCFTEMEVIVVNDGSTDGTKEWLDNYRHPKLRVIHQENKGPAEAINTGVKASQGEYITWMSADNYCADYFVEAFVSALDCEPDISFAYSPYYVIDGKDQIQSIYFASALSLRDLITRTGHNRGNASFMYRKSVHDAVGLYNGWSCDSDMWVKILELYKSVYLIEPVYYYRIHAEMATNTQKAIIDVEVPKILQNFMQRNNGGLSVDLLRRLYPAMKNAQTLAPMALADFSCRMFYNGMRNEALTYLKIALSMYAFDDLLRLMLNFIALTSMIRMDALPHIQEAVDKNATLTDEMRAALMTSAQSLIALYGLKSKKELFLIDHETMPEKYDMPKIFSYVAWKNGASVPPLPAL